MADHTLTFTTDELDQVVKSLMKSVSANTDKRRRLKDGSQQAASAARDGTHLTASLTKAMAAQAQQS